MKFEIYCVDRHCLRQAPDQFTDDALESIVGHIAADTSSAPDQRHQFMLVPHFIQKAGCSEAITGQPVENFLPARQGRVLTPLCKLFVIRTNGHETVGFMHEAAVCDTCHRGPLFRRQSLSRNLFDLRGKKRRAVNA